MGIMVLLTIAIFIIVLIFAFTRGAGTTIWFLILAIILGIISSGLSSVLAPMIDIGKHKDVENSRGLWELIFFSVSIISALPFSIFLDKYTQWVFDPADWFFAFIFGVITCCIVVHYFLESFYFASHGNEIRVTFENSQLFRQMVQFEGWHNFVTWFNTVVSGEKRPTIDLPPDK